MNLSAKLAVNKPVQATAAGTVTMADLLASHNVSLPHGWNAMFKKEGNTPVTDQPYAIGKKITVKIEIDNDHGNKVAELPVTFTSAVNGPSVPNLPTNETNIANQVRAKAIASYTNPIKVTLKTVDGNDNSVLYNDLVPGLLPTGWNLVIKKNGNPEKGNAYGDGPYTIKGLELDDNNGRTVASNLSFTFEKN